MELSMSCLKFIGAGKSEFMDKIDYLYNNAARSLFKLLIVGFSFFFGSVTTCFIVPSPTFYRITLIFSLGFIYEYSIVLVEHRRTKEYPFRVTREAYLGLVVYVIVFFVCVIRFSDSVQNPSVLYPTDTWGQLIFWLSASSLVIIAIEATYAGLPYLSKKWNKEKNISIHL